MAIDVGSGTGLLTLALAPCVSQLWAIDLAPLMGEHARAKALSACVDNVQTVTASAVSLPLVDEAATVAVSNYCVHHLNEQNKRRALAEIHRVLRPGGRLAT